MKITFDKSVNAVYISLTSLLQDKPYHTYPCDPLEVGGEINLDFDATGRLVGIEVIDAKQLLPDELFTIAEVIG